MGAILHRYATDNVTLYQGWPTRRSPSVSWSIALDLALN